MSSSCLDSGAPVKSEHYLKWKTAGAADGELVFVAGHPGSTDRLRTVAELETQRDHLYPTSLKVVKRRLGVLRDYARQGEEPARQAADITFGLENALKALTGEYNGLLDTKIMAKKQEDERAFLALVNGNDAWKRQYGGAWTVIAEAEKRHRALLKPERFQSLRGSQLAGLAAAIVRYGAEIQKPDGERLDGYHDAQLPSLLPYLTSPRPFHLPLEEALLSDALQESVEELGPGDPFVKAVVGSDGRLMSRRRPCREPGWPIRPFARAWWTAAPTRSRSPPIPCWCWRERWIRSCGRRRSGWRTKSKA